MKVIWHIAEEVWADRPGDKFSDALNKRDDVKIVQYKRDIKSFTRNIYDISSISDNAGAVYPWMGPNVIHGPIRFVNERLAELSGLDSIIITNFKDNLRVSDYMSLYPLEWFLNFDGYFTTYKMLETRLIDRPVFVRPNSPFKVFTGMEMNLGNFKKEMDSLKSIQNVPDNEILFISSPKQIQSEFRCVIIDKKVVAYSEYRWDNVLDIRRDILPECLELAEKVAAYPEQIDDAYIVDICMSDDGPKIVEFNSFSSSGMYACDLDNVVEAMNRFSVRIWEENTKL